MRNLWKSLICKKHVLRTIGVSVILLIGASLNAHSAQVVVTITSTDGGIATVTLDTASQTWKGSNDSGEKLLKSTNGNYKAGTSLTPGNAVKGTNLLVGGNDKELEAFLQNLIPTEGGPGNSGEATMYGTATNGKWKRK